MKKERFRWKPRWHFYLHSFWWESWRCFFGAGWGKNCVAWKPSNERVHHSRARRERGFLLVFLLPILLLLLLFFAGSVSVALRAQARIALQSRLDICAVKLALGRKRALENLASTNLALRSSVTAIYVARGLLVAGGPVGAAGAGGQSALLRVNQTLALAQNLLLTKLAAAEAQSWICRATKYSHEKAGCLLSPPALTAFRREKTLFPDVRGALVHRREGPLLASVRCAGGKGLVTEIALRGDAHLVRARFEENYER